MHAYDMPLPDCRISNLLIKSQWRHTDVYVRVKAAQDVEILIAFHTALYCALARKFLFIFGVNSINID